MIDIVFGILIGWFSLGIGAIVLARRLAKNPPEAAIRAIAKATARQAVKAVKQTK